MSEENEIYLESINNLTEIVSNRLLDEFLNLPEDLQKNIVLIKVAELLLANILCHVAKDNDELAEITQQELVELKELITDCAISGFAAKFTNNKH